MWEYTNVQGFIKALTNAVWLAHAWSKIYASGVITPPVANHRLCLINIHPSPEEPTMRMYGIC